MAPPANLSANGQAPMLARRISVGAPTPFESLGQALRTAFGPGSGCDTAGAEFDRLLDKLR